MPSDPSQPSKPSDPSQPSQPGSGGGGSIPVPTCPVPVATLPPVPAPVPVPVPTCPVPVAESVPVPAPVPVPVPTCPVPVVESVPVPAPVPVPTIPVPVVPVPVYVAPTPAPSDNPTGTPTGGPTGAPVTDSPTGAPTEGPTPVPVPSTPSGTCTDTVTLEDGTIVTVSLDLSNLDNEGTITIVEPDMTTITPSVHYVYIVDVSGSTGEACRPDATILDCEKEAVLALNEIVVASNQAASVSLISFSRRAQERYFGAPTTSAVFENVVDRLFPGGVTAFGPPLTVAADSVQRAFQNPDVTSAKVIFITDGVPSNPSEDIADAVASIEVLGATIDSFAVGQEASCTAGTVQQYLQFMADETDGTCSTIENVANLPDILVEVSAVVRQVELVGVTIEGAAAVVFDLNTTVPFGEGSATANIITPTVNGTEVCILADGRAGDDRALVRCCVENTLV